MAAMPVKSWSSLVATAAAAPTMAVAKPRNVSASEVEGSILASAAGLATSASISVQKPHESNAQSISDNTNGEEASILSPAEATTMSTSSTIRVAILDSSVFMSATFSVASSLGSDCQYLTTPTVVNELKDEQSRTKFDTFPYPIQVVMPSEKSIAESRLFAMATGDYNVLSTTDLHIIALAREMERTTNALKYLRLTPAIQINERLFRLLMARSEKKKAEELARRENESEAQEDLEQQDQKPKFDEEDGRRLGFVSNWYDDEPQPSESIPDEHSSEIVPPPQTNPSSFLNQLNSNGTHKNESSVVCITHDFTMQNILLQMGIRLLSLNGNTIRSIRYWIKKCHACFSYTSDMNRQFCEQCGHHTMIRVNVVIEKVDELNTHADETSSDNGVIVDGFKIRMWHGWRHLNTRGTIYSIPKPSGGRDGKPLKFTEDVMDSFHKRNSKPRKSKNDWTDGVGIFDEKSRSKVNHQDVFGFGRRNPNEGRKNRRR